MLRDDGEVLACVRAEKRSASHLASAASRSVSRSLKNGAESVRDAVLPAIGKRLVLLSLGAWDTIADVISGATRWLRSRRGALLGRVRTVTSVTHLRVRAAKDARIAVALDHGARILVYPEHGSRPGWILARTIDGEVGFIEKQLLA